MNKHLDNKAADKYFANKAAKTGSICLCPTCGNRFTKKSYQQAFCRIKCKDRYWNHNDPVRQERMVRYLSAPVEVDEDIDD